MTKQNNMTHRIFTALATGISALLLFVPASASGAGRNQKPFGWAVCSSIGSGDDYELTGGRGGRKTVLKSNGADMKNEIAAAISNYDIIILDGTNGPFMVSSTIVLDKVKGKSLLGVNGAVLKTAFDVTPELKKRLLDAKLNRYSWRSGTGGRLSNGRKVDEEREMKTRQLIIDYTGDEKETYRDSGLLLFNNSENVIIRNISFVGPGSVDLGADDCLSLTRKCTHFWVDHCSFCDGMDGNMDITGGSDLNTVSWCKFFYTDKSYDHSFSNLIAGTHLDPESRWDFYNTTFYACEWGAGVQSRTPMARFGTIHLLNCYFNCPKGIDVVNPRDVSEFLVENCWFSENLSKPVIKISCQLHPVKAWTVCGNIFKTPCDLKDCGEVKMPYRYGRYVMNASKVPETVTREVGPVLSESNLF